MRETKWNLSRLVEYWPHENAIMDRDPRSLGGFLGSGGFRLMGRLPEGASTYLASSYIRLETSQQPIIRCDF